MNDSAPTPLVPEPQLAKADRLGISDYIRTRFRSGIKNHVEQLLLFLVAFAFLYVTGNRSQFFEQLNWLLAMGVALAFSILKDVLHWALLPTQLTALARWVIVGFVMVAILGAFLFGYRGTVVRMDSAEIEEFRSKSYYRDEWVWIKNVVDTDGRVTKKTFEGCCLLGPAVVFFSDSVLVEESSNTINLNFQIVRDSANAINGAVIVRNCRFINSYFENVSLIGTQEQIERFKASIVR